MNKNTFYSQVDWWVWLLFIVVIIAMIMLLIKIYGSIQNGYFYNSVLSIVFLLIGIVVAIPVFISTRYIVNNNELIIRSGIFRWAIPIESIISVEPSRDLKNSPALSIDRLKINYIYNSINRDILVSPKDKQEFQNILLNRVKEKNQNSRLDTY